jgi:hypothetical protein
MPALIDDLLDDLGALEVEMTNSVTRGLNRALDITVAREVADTLAYALSEALRTEDVKVAEDALQRARRAAKTAWVLVAHARESAALARRTRELSIPSAPEEIERRARAIRGAALVRWRGMTD